MRSKNKSEDFEQNLDVERIKVEKQKLEVEREKISVEKEKLKLEERKLALTALLEDFKFGWQRLLNFENENSRWISVYASALIIGLFWLLSSKDFLNIQDMIQHGQNKYILLGLACVNSIYILSLAWRGYQFHLLAIFLYEKISPQISILSEVRFNTWWESRRPNKVSYPSIDHIVVIYYVLISVLPFTITGLILFHYYSFSWKCDPTLNWPNFFFYISVVLYLICTVFSALTSVMEIRWKIAIRLREAKESKGNL